MDQHLASERDTNRSRPHAVARTRQRFEDDAVAGSVRRSYLSGEELLSVLPRLEALDLPLSSSRRSMRVFRTIIEVAAGRVSDPWQNRALGNAVAAQAIGDQ